MTKCPKDLGGGGGEMRHQPLGDGHPWTRWRKQLHTAYSHAVGQKQSYVNLICNTFLQPPIVPRISYEGDSRNFDEYPEIDWKSAPGVGEVELKLFEDF